MTHTPPRALVPLAALAALSLAAASASAAPPTTAPEVVVLKAARVFDGRGDAAIVHGTVIVEGAKIKAVGADLPVPAGARVVDLGEATLLPGFVDAHVHLTGEASDSWMADTIAGLRQTVAEQALRASVFARRTLMAGFTTVRNVGAEEFVDVGLRNAINANLVPGPRMLVSAYALGARGGHCDETGYRYHLFGPEPGIEKGVAAGPDAFRDSVRFQVKYGADVIKVCATGGVLSLADEVDTPQVTQDEMNAIVDEAHRLRKRTAAHAHGAEGAKVAIRAGIDSIEHGSFLDEEALRMMKERGTWLVPTLMAGEYVAGKAAERHYPPEIAAKAKAAVEGRSATFRHAVALGVKIAFGTDSAVSPHGRNAEEFALLVQHGMSPAAALRTAGPAAATLLGLEKTIGTLEAGKDADVIAVPGDPLADIHATEKVAFVMRGGKVYRNDFTPQR